MGNISSRPIYKHIPEAIPFEQSEIRQSAKDLWYKLHERAAVIDNMKDPWISQYEGIVKKQPWTLKRVSTFVPGLGIALGIFGVYCTLEVLGLYDDGGWSAWKKKHHH